MRIADDDRGQFVRPAELRPYDTILFRGRWETVRSIKHFVRGIDVRFYDRRGVGYLGHTLVLRLDKIKKP